MSKADAEASDKRITEGFTAFALTVGLELLRMREQEGFKALGHESFAEYVVSLETRIGKKTKVYGLIQAAEVGTNLSKAFGKKIELPIGQATALAQLKAPEQQVEAFKLASRGDKVTEQTVARAVEQVRKNSGSPDKPEKKGWTATEIKEDDDLRKALEKIGQSWGEPDRGAIQRGTVTLKRADVLALGDLTPAQLRRYQNLIMGNRWNFTAASDFLEDDPTRESKVEDLQDWCLANGGAYRATVDGFKVTIEATRAVTKR